MATTNDSFWGSNSGAALIQGLLGVGSGIASAIGQGKQAKASEQLARDQMAQSQGQFNASLAQQQAQANPLAQQQYRQKQALLSALISGARNIQAPAGLQGYVGSGGITIPEGGFGSDVTAFYSPSARANAEGDWYAQTGAKPIDLSSVGYGSSGVAPTQRAKSYYQSSLAANRGSNSAVLNALNGSGSSAPTSSSTNWLAPVLAMVSSLGVPALQKTLFRSTPTVTAPVPNEWN